MFARIAFLCLIIVQFILPQGEGEYLENEFTIQVIDAPNKTITFELSPIGTVFCTEDCEIDEYETSSQTHILNTDGSGDILCQYNGFELRFCSDDDDTIIYGCAQETSGLKPLRWGFYKLTIKENGVLKGYCYFDWRETGFPVNDCNTPCTGNDMSIRYDGDDQVLRFYNIGNPPERESTRRKSWCLSVRW